ncbi:MULTISPECIES: hypothetical protein [unclassified Paenibacillus]|uniref:hypothetical protein n=1 Tax=unclassified Paenibacillus TaxID=185978 RepID=UPI00383683CF
MMGYLLTRQTFWIIPVVSLMPLIFQAYEGYAMKQSLSMGMDNLLFCFIGIWVSFVANAYHQKKTA